MTQFSDDIYLGAANTGITAGNNGGTGIGPMGRSYTFDVVPAALAANNIATSQTAAGAGNLTLTAGAGVTSVARADGYSVLQVDTPRNVRVTSGGNDTGLTFTVTGWDLYGQPMSEAITGASGAAAAGKKAFSQVYTVAASGATASNVTVGTGDVLGLPARLYDINHVISVKWASVLADDAATVVAGDATSPATTTTGDVRGTVDPSSATNGSRRLTVTYFLGGIASGPDATRAGALGVNQNLVG